MLTGCSSRGTDNGMICGTDDGMTWASRIHRSLSWRTPLYELMAARQACSPTLAVISAGHGQHQRDDRGAGIFSRHGLLRSDVIIGTALPPNSRKSAISGWPPTGRRIPVGHLRYAATLRGLGAVGDGDILVAVDDGQLAPVMLQRWPHAGEVVRGPDEAEIRALAVAPGGRGQGTGRALVRAVIDRAASDGIRHLVLCTMGAMRTAHHLYERARFAACPDRDWSPEPDVTLLAYGLLLPGPAVAGLRGSAPGSFAPRCPAGRVPPSAVLPFARASLTPLPVATPPVVIPLAATEPGRGAETFLRCLVIERKRKYRTRPIPATTRNPGELRGPAALGQADAARTITGSLSPRIPANRSSSGCLQISTSERASW